MQKMFNFARKPLFACLNCVQNMLFLLFRRPSTKSYESAIERGLS